jgi:hypothetical protein
LEQLDLTPYKLQAEIIQQTIHQIIKDFSMFGMEIYFTGNVAMAYEEIYRQLCGFIETLIIHDFHKLLALLYQIDLSDEAIIKAEEEHPNTTRHEIIAELLLYRELRKVVYRNYYKKEKGIEG